MSLDFLKMGLKAQIPQIEKRPWMHTVTMELVTSETLDRVIDECIESKLYALDLETTGLDNRVFDGTTKDKIVGFCLSPDGERGYYIPVRHNKGEEHNIPVPVAENAMRRLVNSGSIAIFHNAKFDQEFLQFAGGDPIGTWEDPTSFEDTLILAYLRNTREKNKGLKHLSKVELEMEMIELKDLWENELETAAQKRNKKIDFSSLDPSWDPCVWYAASDAICTYRLFKKLHPQVIPPDNPRSGQPLTYQLEKMCLPATRWMERCRVWVDQDKVAELMRLGQQEFYDCLVEVYDFCNEKLGRNVEPGWFRLLRNEFVADDPDFNINKQIEDARTRAHHDALDRLGDDGHYIKVETEFGQFPEKYDVLSRPQLGPLFQELRIPGLRKTTKSGQIKTTQDEVERLNDQHGERYPFLPKIKRMGELQKALGTYLISLHRDVGPDGTLRVNYNQLGTDTGRFTTPSSSRPELDGGTKYPMHGTPATYDKSRPECLLRIREAIKCREPDWIMAAIDFGGVELRIATNLSGEPLWLKEYFRCSTCGQKFDEGDGTNTPEAPPAYCPRCGDDKIGDLHTLTGIAFFGEERVSSKQEGKMLRGMAKCVHPDTLIFTQDGLIPMGNLSLGRLDTFLDIGGNIWNGAQEVPLKATYNGGAKQLYHVITRQGAVTCSENHRFSMADGSLRSISDGLKVGDLLSIPKNPPQMKEGQCPPLRFKFHEDVPETHIQTSEEIAYFCGLYCGGGIKDGSCSVSLAHGHVDNRDIMGVPYKDWQNHLMSICEGIGFQPVARDASVYLGGANTMRYMETLGLFNKEGERSLRIPSWVLQGGREATLQFFGGLFDIEGTVEKTTKAGQITTKDAVFFGQLMAALQTLDFNPSAETSWDKTSEQYYYRLSIQKPDLVQLKPYLRNPGSPHQIEACEPSQDLVDNQVCAIVPAGFLPCMDVSVGTEDHLYWCNGLITHNSSNFALAYGGGPNALVRAAGIPEEDAGRFHRTFNNTYTTLKGWWDTVRNFGKRHGYVVTALGRQYPIPDIRLPTSPKGVKDALIKEVQEGKRATEPTGPEIRDIMEMNRGFQAKAERNATNGPIQGTSADITKLAMGRIYRLVKEREWFDKVRMTITIHDELVFEVHKSIVVEALELFQHTMTRNSMLMKLKWKVPLTTDCEIGYDWTVPWDIKDFRFKRVRQDGLQVDESGRLPRKKGKLEAKLWPKEFVDIFGPRYGYAPVLDNPTEAEGRALFGEDWTPLPLEGDSSGETSSTVSSESGSKDLETVSNVLTKPTEVSIDTPERTETILNTDPVEQSPVLAAPSLNKGEVFVFTLPEIGVGIADKLAKVIVRCQGHGTHPLKVLGPDGKNILWEGANILVNPIQFEAFAEAYGL